jgi:segregation and condensation protein B
MSAALPAGELALRIEAVLFAGGKPMSPSELAEALGLSDPHAVSAALRTLCAGYEERPTALELRRVGDRYALQLREEYVPVARSVTPMEMSPRTLKSLTLVAYHQPMLQSFLVRMVGEGAYEQVQRLRGMGLLHAEAKGSTLELTTTRLFAEYFGIGSTRPEEIRRYLERKVGIPSPPTPSPALEPPTAAPPPSEPEPPRGAEAPPPGAMMDPEPDVPSSL